MGAITIDESSFPLVRVTFDGPVDDEAFARYLDTMSRLLERRTKNVVVFDARRASPNLKQMSAQSEWLQAHREKIWEFSCGSVFVIVSAVVRGALTAILRVSPIPGTFTVVGTLAEAERWAVDRLAKAGISLPPTSPAAPA